MVKKKKTENPQNILDKSIFACFYNLNSHLSRIIEKLKPLSHPQQGKSEAANTLISFLYSRNDIINEENTTALINQLNVLVPADKSNPNLKETQNKVENIKKILQWISKALEVIEKNANARELLDPTYREIKTLIIGRFYIAFHEIVLLLPATLERTKTTKEDCKNRLVEIQQKIKELNISTQNFLKILEFTYSKEDLQIAATNCQDSLNKMAEEEAQEELKRLAAAHIIELLKEYEILKQGKKLTAEKATELFEKIKNTCDALSQAKKIELSDKIDSILKELKEFKENEELFENFGNLEHDLDEIIGSVEEIKNPQELTSYYGSLKEKFDTLKKNDKLTLHRTLSKVFKKADELRSTQNETVSIPDNQTLKEIQCELVQLSIAEDKTETQSDKEEDLSSSDNNQDHIEKSIKEAVTFIFNIENTVATKLKDQFIVRSGNLNALPAIYIYPNKFIQLEICILHIFNYLNDHYPEETAKLKEKKEKLINNLINCIDFMANIKIDFNNTDKKEKEDTFAELAIRFSLIVPAINNFLKAVSKANIKEQDPILKLINQKLTPKTKELTRDASLRAINVENELSKNTRTILNKFNSREDTIRELENKFATLFGVEDPIHAVASNPMPKIKEITPTTIDQITKFEEFNKIYELIKENSTLNLGLADALHLKAGQFYLKPSDDTATATNQKLKEIQAETADYINAVEDLQAETEKTIKALLTLGKLSTKKPTVEELELLYNSFHEIYDDCITKISQLNKKQATSFEDKKTIIDEKLNNLYFYLKAPQEPNLKPETADLEIKSPEHNKELSRNPSQQLIFSKKPDALDAIISIIKLINQLADKQEKLTNSEAEIRLTQLNEVYSELAEFNKFYAVISGYIKTFKNPTFNLRADNTQNNIKEFLECAQEVQKQEDPDKHKNLIMQFISIIMGLQDLLAATLTRKEFKDVVKGDSYNPSQLTLLNACTRLVANTHAFLTKKMNMKDKDIYDIADIFIAQNKVSNQQSNEKHANPDLLTQARLNLLVRMFAKAYLNKKQPLEDVYVEVTYQLIDQINNETLALEILKQKLDKIISEGTFEFYANLKTGYAYSKEAKHANAYKLINSDLGKHIYTNYIQFNKGEQEDFYDATNFLEGLKCVAATTRRAEFNKTRDNHYERLLNYFFSVLEIMKRNAARYSATAAAAIHVKQMYFADSDSVSIAKIRSLFNDAFLLAFIQNNKPELKKLHSEALTSLTDFESNQENVTALYNALAKFAELLKVNKDYSNEDSNKTQKIDSTEIRNEWGFNKRPVWQTTIPGNDLRIHIAGFLKEIEDAYNKKLKEKNVDEQPAQPNPAAAAPAGTAPNVPSLKVKDSHPDIATLVNFLTNIDARPVHIAIYSAAALLFYNSNIKGKFTESEITNHMIFLGDTFSTVISADINKLIESAYKYNSTLTNPYSPNKILTQACKIICESPEYKNHVESKEKNKAAVKSSDEPKKPNKIRKFFSTITESRTNKPNPKKDRKSQSSSKTPAKPKLTEQPLTANQLKGSIELVIARTIKVTKGLALVSNTEDMLDNLKHIFITDKQHNYNDVLKEALKDIKKTLLDESHLQSFENYFTLCDSLNSATSLTPSDFENLTTNFYDAINELHTALNKENVKSKKDITKTPFLNNKSLENFAETSKKLEVEKDRIVDLLAIAENQISPVLASPEYEKKEFAEAQQLKKEILNQLHKLQSDALNLRNDPLTYGEIIKDFALGKDDEEILAKIKTNKYLNDDKNLIKYVQDTYEWLQKSHYNESLDQNAQTTEEDITERLIRHFKNRFSQHLINSYIKNLKASVEDKKSSGWEIDYLEIACKFLEGTYNYQDIHINTPLSCSALDASILNGVQLEKKIGIYPISVSNSTETAAHFTVMLIQKTPNGYDGYYFDPKGNEANKEIQDVNNLIKQEFERKFKGLKFESNEIPVQQSGDKVNCGPICTAFIEKFLTDKKVVSEIKSEENAGEFSKIIPREEKVFFDNEILEVLLGIQANNETFKVSCDIGKILNLITLIKANKQADPEKLNDFIKILEKQLQSYNTIFSNNPILNDHKEQSVNNAYNKAILILKLLIKQARRLTTRRETLSHKATGDEQKDHSSINGNHSSSLNGTAMNGTSANSNGTQNGGGAGGGEPPNPNLPKLNPTKEEEILKALEEQGEKISLQIKQFGELINKSQSLDQVDLELLEELQKQYSDIKQELNEFRLAVLKQNNDLTPLIEKLATNFKQVSENVLSLAKDKIDTEFNKITTYTNVLNQELHLGQEPHLLVLENTVEDCKGIKIHSPLFQNYLNIAQTLDSNYYKEREGIYKNFKYLETLLVKATIKLGSLKKRQSYEQEAAKSAAKTKLVTRWTDILDNLSSLTKLVSEYKKRKNPLTITITITSNSIDVVKFLTDTKNITFNTDEYKQYCTLLAGEKIRINKKDYKINELHEKFQEEIKILDKFSELLSSMVMQIWEENGPFKQKVNLLETLLQTKPIDIKTFRKAYEDYTKFDSEILNNASYKNNKAIIQTLNPELFKLLSKFETEYSKITQYYEKILTSLSKGNEQEAAKSAAIKELTTYWNDVFNCFSSLTLWISQYRDNKTPLLITNIKDAANFLTDAKTIISTNETYKQHCDLIAGETINISILSKNLTTGELHKEFQERIKILDNLAALFSNVDQETGAHLQKISNEMIAIWGGKGRYDQNLNQLETLLQINPINMGALQKAYEDYAKLSDILNATAYQNNKEIIKKLNPELFTFISKREEQYYQDNQYYKEILTKLAKQNEIAEYLNEELLISNASAVLVKTENQAIGYYNKKLVNALPKPVKANGSEWIHRNQAKLKLAVLKEEVNNANQITARSRKIANYVALSLVIGGAAAWVPVTLVGTIFAGSAVTLTCWGLAAYLYSKYNLKPERVKKQFAGVADQIVKLLLAPAVPYNNLPADEELTVTMPEVGLGILYGFQVQVDGKEEFEWGNKNLAMECVLRLYNYANEKFDARESFIQQILEICGQNDSKAAQNLITTFCTAQQDPDIKALAKKFTDLMALRKDDPNCIEHVKNLCACNSPKFLIYKLVQWSYYDGKTKNIPSFSASLDYLMEVLPEEVNWLLRSVPYEKLNKAVNAAVHSLNAIYTLEGTDGVSAKIKGMKEKNQEKLLNLLRFLIQHKPNHPTIQTLFPQIRNLLAESDPVRVLQEIIAQRKEERKGQKFDLSSAELIKGFVAKFKPEQIAKGLNFALENILDPEDKVGLSVIVDVLNNAETTLDRNNIELIPVYYPAQYVILKNLIPKNAAKLFKELITWNDRSVNYATYKALISFLTFDVSSSKLLQVELVELYRNAEPRVFIDRIKNLFAMAKDKEEIDALLKNLLKAFSPQTMSIFSWGDVHSVHACLFTAYDEYYRHDLNNPSVNSPLFMVTVFESEQRPHHFKAYHHSAYYILTKLSANPKPKDVRAAFEIVCPNTLKNETNEDADIRISTFINNFIKANFEQSKPKGSENDHETIFAQVMNGFAKTLQGPYNINIRVRLTNSYLTNLTQKNMRLEDGETEAPKEQIILLLADLSKEIERTKKPSTINQFIQQNILPIFIAIENNGNIETNVLSILNELETQSPGAAGKLLLCLREAFKDDPTLETYREKLMGELITLNSNEDHNNKKQKFLRSILHEAYNLSKNISHKSGSELGFCKKLDSIIFDLAKTFFIATQAPNDPQPILIGKTSWKVAPTGWADILVTFIRLSLSGGVQSERENLITACFEQCSKYEKITQDKKQKQAPLTKVTVTSLLNPLLLYNNAKIALADDAQLKTLNTAYNKTDSGILFNVPSDENQIKPDYHKIGNILDQIRNEDQPRGGIAVVRPDQAAAGSEQHNQFQHCVFNFIESFAEEKTHANMHEIDLPKEDGKEEEGIDAVEERVEEAKKAIALAKHFILGYILGKGKGENSTQAVVDILKSCHAYLSHLRLDNIDEYMSQLLHNTKQELSKQQQKDLDDIITTNLDLTMRCLSADSIQTILEDQVKDFFNFSRVNFLGNSNGMAKDEKIKYKLDNLNNQILQKIRNCLIALEIKQQDQGAEDKFKKQAIDIPKTVKNIRRLFFHSDFTYGPQLLFKALLIDNQSMQNLGQIAHAIRNDININEVIKNLCKNIWDACRMNIEERTSDSKALPEKNKGERLYEVYTGTLKWIVQPLGNNNTFAGECLETTYQTTLKNSGWQLHFEGKKSNEYNDADMEESKLSSDSPAVF